MRAMWRVCHNQPGFLPDPDAIWHTEDLDSALDTFLEDIKGTMDRIDADDVDEQDPEVQRLWDTYVTGAQEMKATWKKGLEPDDGTPRELGARVMLPWREVGYLHEIILVMVSETQYNEIMEDQR
jgi:hypothetical protein